MNGENLLFVYPRRKGAGLAYWLETSGNLLSNDWVASGYTELPGVGSIDADFEAISNSVPTAESQAFIRLMVEEQ